MCIIQYTLIPVYMDTCNIKAPYFHSYNRYFMSHMPKHQNYWFTSNCTVQHKSSLFSCLLPISLFIDNYGKIAKIYILIKMGMKLFWFFIIIYERDILYFILHVVYWRCQYLVGRKIESHKRTKLALHTISKRNQNIILSIQVR